MKVSLHLKNILCGQFNIKIVWVRMLTFVNYEIKHSQNPIHIVQNTYPSPEVGLARTWNRPSQLLQRATAIQSFT